MIPELRTQLVDSLHRRATQLAKITAPSVLDREDPRLDSVIAFIAQQVFFTCVVLLGQQLFTAWTGQLFNSVNEQYGVCRFCHDREDVPSLGMCQACWDQARADDEAAPAV